MDIHENIRKHRKQRGLTQEGLAEAMGVSCAAVSKWENGQSAPDLSMLAALADYFEVSIDTLMGHQVKADRQETLLEELTAACDGREIEKAEALCEMLLQTYPNDPKVVQSCADVYDSLYVYTRQTSYMELCIDQLKRLFTLKKGEPEAERLERLLYLANCHEHLEQWEQAKTYFEQSNVDGINDCDIARCLLGLGRTKEALTKASDVFLTGVFRQYANINVLADAWRAMEEAPKALDALEWMRDSMERLGYIPEIVQILCMQIAAIQAESGDREKAFETLNKVEEQIAETEKGNWNAPSFLRPEKNGKFRSSFEDNKQLLAIAKAALQEESRKREPMTIALVRSDKEK